MAFLAESSPWEGLPLKTTKSGETNRLALVVFGSCGLAFLPCGCSSDATEQVGISIGSTEPAEDTGADETTGGESDGSTGSEETEPDTGSTTAEEEGSTSSDATDESTDDGGSPPPLEGPGCGVQPVCDRGTYEGTVTLSDEASMDVIAGYSHITGFLLIRGTELTCLDFLACLESARGLSIDDNEHLVNLDGLGALEQVRFGISISRNAALEDVSGLSSLSKLSSDGDDVQLGLRGLVIFENPSLEAIAGFDALQSFEGDLSITNNASLVEISGFGALDVVAKHPNPNHGWNQPPTVAGSVSLSKNKVLKRVTGFTALSAIEENLVIQYNDVLDDLSGLHNLQAVGGALVITHNPQLCISEAYEVGGELEVGPLDLGSSSTANNKHDC
jgi:hypothetical protein